MKTRGISFLLALVLTVSSFWLPASGTEVVWAKEEQTQEEIQEEKQTEEEGVVTEAPSVMLMEVSTGTILFQKNAQEQRSPASITKIMTLLLIFEELEKGTVTMEEEVVTSAYAKSMGGSQVFLEEGEKQTVETMIKCIVVASGNDASVAMAEHIAGSEAEFVKRMNQRARELGMVHTNFEDCCGLTESAEHYTTAEDVALVSRELLRRFPKILEYSSIWMENITHVTRQGSKEFCLTNTNKLVRSYDGCVGLKTGSTSVAKFCVSAVAKRGDLMLLAVVMGAPDPKVRFKDAAALLDYGFGNCALYTDENKDSLKPVSVSRGAKKEAACRYKGAFHYLDTKGRNLEKVEKEILYEKNLKAPVKKGSVVGKAVYTLDGEKIGQMEIVSAENIRKAGFADYLKRVAGKLLGMKA
ncbi:MAG: D-alanyl-D-alanine carboxypeptidase family protein [Ruminococcus sp.]